MPNFQQLMNSTRNKLKSFFAGEVSYESSPSDTQQNPSYSGYYGYDPQQGQNVQYAPAPPSYPQQEPQAYAPQQQPVMQDNIVPFPNAQNAAAERSDALRVINARGISDCYSAIAQLRSGDIVIIVLDAIRDAAEMRHYVDMLSGACFSLQATITKLSRYGAYLLCPQTCQVFVDNATNQLNSAAVRQSPAQMQYTRQNTGAAQRSTPMNYNPQEASGGFSAQTQPRPDPISYQTRNTPVMPQTRANIQSQRYGGYRPDDVEENYAESSAL